jgi:hypothetical protein
MYLTEVLWALKTKITAEFKGNNGMEEICQKKIELHERNCKAVAARD